MLYGISYGGYNKHGIFTKSGLNKEEIKKVWEGLTRWQKLTADIWPIDTRTARGKRLYNILGIKWAEL